MAEIKDPIKQSSVESQTDRNVCPTGYLFTVFSAMLPIIGSLNFCPW